MRGAVNFRRQPHDCFSPRFTSMVRATTDLPQSHLNIHCSLPLFALLACFKATSRLYLCPSLIVDDPQASRRSEHARVAATPRNCVPPALDTNPARYRYCSAVCCLGSYCKGEHTQV